MMPTFPESALDDIQVAKAMGGRVFLREMPPTSVGDCQNCGGSGVLWLEFKKGGPFASPSSPRAIVAGVDGSWIAVESKTYNCPICTDKSAMIRDLFERSGLEPAEHDWRVDYIAGMQGKDLAIASAHGILEKVPRPAGWLVIYGDYGRGKSGLLKSVVAQCALAGVQAHYTRAADILDEIKATYGKDVHTTESEVKARLSSWRVLAIDEVDRISGTDWANSTLMSILDTRYTRRSQCCTLFATNSQPNEMPKGFEYLASRFMDGKRVPIGGIDLRGKK
jgi:hypothetical protein